MKAITAISSLIAVALVALASLAMAEGPRVRILTYNIHHGEGTDGKLDLPRLAKVIRGASPDLVALQEVDRKTKRNGDVDQAAELARLTEMHVEFGKSIDIGAGEYGNAILSSKKPLEIKLHSLPQDDLKSERRTALAVRVKLSGDLPELWFASTHFCHLREANRIAQAKEINRLFPTDGTPVLLAGDLNARSNSDSHQELARQWTDTLPGVKTIDYVLPRRNDPWKLIEAKVLDELVASDHKPVLVVLEWTGAKP